MQPRINMINITPDQSDHCNPNQSDQPRINLINITPINLINTTPINLINFTRINLIIVTQDQTVCSCPRALEKVEEKKWEAGPFLLCCSVFTELPPSTTLSPIWVGEWRVMTHINPQGKVYVPGSGPSLQHLNNINFFSQSWSSSYIYLHIDI